MATCRSVASSDGGWCRLSTEGAGHGIPGPATAETHCRGFSLCREDVFLPFSEKQVGLPERPLTNLIVRRPHGQCRYALVGEEWHACRKKNRSSTGKWSKVRKRRSAHWWRGCSTSLWRPSTNRRGGTSSSVSRTPTRWRAGDAPAVLFSWPDKRGSLWGCWSLFFPITFHCCSSAFGNGVLPGNLWLALSRERSSLCRRCRNLPSILRPMPRWSTDGWVFCGAERPGRSTGSGIFR